jgi:hypothetical protein
VSGAAIEAGGTTHIGKTPGFFHDISHEYIQRFGSNFMVLINTEMI